MKRGNGLKMFRQTVKMETRSIQDYKIYGNCNNM